MFSITHFEAKEICSKVHNPHTFFSYPLYPHYVSSIFTAFFKGYYFNAPILLKYFFSWLVQEPLLIFHSQLDLIQALGFLLLSLNANAHKTKTDDEQWGGGGVWDPNTVLLLAAPARVISISGQTGGLAAWWRLSFKENVAGTEIYTMN